MAADHLQPRPSQNHEALCSLSFLRWCCCMKMSRMETHIRWAPVLKHSKNVAELDLQSKASFPFWFHCNVLTKLPLHFLHALMEKATEGQASLNLQSNHLTLMQNYHTVYIYRMKQGWDRLYLHAFKKTKKDSEALQELSPKLFGPHWWFTDQNVPEWQRLVTS